jgi:hypothetical protein
MQKNGTSSRAVPSLLLVLALAAPGCGKETKKSHPDADTTPPVVSSTAPADGATDVPVTQVLAAVFSEPLRCATVGTSSVVVGAEEAVAGVVGCDGANVTFAPAAPLEPATRYTATLTTDIQDAAGNALAAVHRWSFTTAAEADTTPPTVTSTTPADGAGDVSVELAGVAATFSEPVDCDSVTAASFELGFEVMVGGTIGCDGATVTFTPTGRLAYETVYTATLTTAIRDRAGNALASPVAWSFTTEPAPDTTPPTLVEMHPAGGATGVPRDVSISATFSEPMDAGVLIAAFTVNQDGEPVGGSYTYDENRVAFTPDAPLAAGTTYTATVTTAATDLAGNHLWAAVVWTFTTAGASARILYSWAGDLFAVGEDGTGHVTLAGSYLTGESFAGVSPSGRIVYRLGEGELHSVASDGSGDVTIVGGTTPLDFLGFSGSGRILYRQNGNLYAVDEDGANPATLANTGDVEPLAYVSGERVVFLRWIGPGRSLDSVLDDGTGAVTLDGTPNIKLVYLVGPDGAIYYYRDMSGAYPNDDVYAVAPDGLSPPVPIAATTTYNEGLVALAPDGTPIVTGCLSVMCEEEILFPGGADLHLGRGGVRGVMPDNRIVFERGDLGALDIGTCSTGGAGVIDVATDPTLNEHVVGIHPDGHILYTTRSASADLHAVYADGSGAVTLADTAEDETFMGVSPEGWVVYESAGDGTVSLRAVHADGSAPRTLAQAAWLGFAGFSSTGKVVYRASDAGGAVNLWIAGFDDAPPVKLTDHSGNLSPEYFGSLP